MGQIQGFLPTRPRRISGFCWQYPTKDLKELPVLAKRDHRLGDLLRAPIASVKRAWSYPQTQ